MATIEERAKAYATMLNQTTDEIWVDYYEYDAYIKGAIEQRKIDIDKACEWLKDKWGKYIDQTGECDCTMRFWIEDFRKAMEGKE